MTYTNSHDWQCLTGSESTQTKAALKAFVLSLTSDPFLADDVVQETLLRTSRSVRFATLENPLAYMITVAKSVLYDHQKKSFSNTVDWQSEELEAANDSPENVHLHSQKLEFVQSVLAAMSDIRRTIFLMRRVDGLSRDDIATRLDVSVEVVKKHLTRAMIELTQKLEDAGWAEKPIKK